MWYEDPLLISISITVGLAGAVIIYLGDTLHKMLLDHSASVVRAKFWASLSHVVLMVLPVTIQLIVCLAASPENSNPIYAVLLRTQWGLLGLAVAVLALGVVIGIFGRQIGTPIWVPPEQADDLNKLLSRVQELRAKEYAGKTDSSYEDDE